MKKAILTTEEVVATVGLSRTSIWRLEQRGEFPRRRQVSTQRVGWLHSEVMAWVESRPEAGVRHETSGA